MAAPTRLERRKARTRAALVRAAQTFVAAGTLNVPVVQITQAADVGLGSFYNHFQTKEELFRAAVEEALDLFGQALDEYGAGVDDPADVFARSFRLTGRFHRRNPELSKVVLHDGLALWGSDKGLGPRLRRDIEAGVRRGRFTVSDPATAVVTIGGAGLALGRFLHDCPDRDDAKTTDQVTEDLLRMLGLSPGEAREVSRRPLPDFDHLAPFAATA